MLKKNIAVPSRIEALNETLFSRLDVSELSSARTTVGSDDVSSLNSSKGSSPPLDSISSSGRSSESSQSVVGVAAAEIFVVDGPFQMMEASNSTTTQKYIIPTGFKIKDERVVTTIDCDFILQSHPQLDHFVEFAYQQGVAAKLYPDNTEKKSAVKEKIQASYYVQLAINTLPDSTDTKKLEAMVNWILLLFAFDNVIDSLTGVIPKQAATLRAYTDLLSEKVQGNSAVSEEALSNRLKADGVPDGEVELALKPFRLGDFLVNQTRAFHEEARRYFESSLLEMYKPKSMNLPKYLSVRKDSGAIDSVVRLAEGDLPDYFQKSAYFKHMNSSIVDYIWAVNDIGGAKEFGGHEPAYLKIQARTHYLEQVKANAALDKSHTQIEAFKTSMLELLNLINDAHENYYHTKSETLSSIRDGSIFNQSSVEIEFRGMHQSAQSMFKAQVEEDFLRRCAIRENLAAAGNECTKVSPRYVNFKDPEKNVDLSQPWTL